LKAISSERRERKVYSVALRDEIRTWVLIQGKSQRAAAQHFGLSRNTVAKLLAEEPAATVRQYQRQAPKITPVRDLALPYIEGWLKENEWKDALGSQTTLDGSSHVDGTAQAGDLDWGIDGTYVCAGEAKAREISLRPSRLCSRRAGRV
jgi:hypothetical protein